MHTKTSLINIFKPKPGEVLTGEHEGDSTAGATSGIGVTMDRLEERSTSTGVSARHVDRALKLRVEDLRILRKPWPMVAEME